MLRSVWIYMAETWLLPWGRNLDEFGIARMVKRNVGDTLLCNSCDNRAFDCFLTVRNNGG